MRRSGARREFSFFLCGTLLCRTRTHTTTSFKQEAFLFYAIHFLLLFPKPTAIMRLTTTTTTTTPQQQQQDKAEEKESALLSFCRRFARNDGTLSICNLHHNVSNRGAVRLAHALKSTTSPLVVLFLDSAGIGATGAQALAASLQHLPSLRYLYLSYNDMGNRGAVALAEQLLDNSCNSSLQVLKLAHNHIGNAGACRMAKALQHNPSLEQLNLHGNDIQQEGLCALADGLGHNTNLRLLHVQDNLWRHSNLAVQERFLQILRRGDNQTLLELKIILDPCTTIEDTGPLQTAAHGMYQSSSIRSQQQEEIICRGQIEFWLALNRLGRQFLGTANVSPSAWTRVLARAATHTEQPQDLVYTLLRMRPDLVSE